jgi:hypothetical protein
LLSSYPALSMTAYSYLFGAGLMTLTGGFFANGLSDWTLTHTEIACVLFSVRSFLLHSLPVLSVVDSCVPRLSDTCICLLCPGAFCLYTILTSMNYIKGWFSCAGNCCICTQLLAVELVKQDLGTLVSCIVHASSATCLIHPFTYFFEEFTLLGKVSSTSPFLIHRLAYRRLKSNRI